MVLGLLHRGNNIGDDNRQRNVTANRQPSNLLEMALCFPWGIGACMKTYRHLFQTLCSYENLFEARENAKMPLRRLETFINFYKPK